MIQLVDEESYSYWNPSARIDLVPTLRYYPLFSLRVLSLLSLGLLNLSEKDTDAKRQGGSWF